jgi:hypothetical protein
VYQIADRLGCGRGTVAVAIGHWFGSRGLAVPDGRTRRQLPARGLTDAPGTPHAAGDANITG